jgi:hypothetical protein
MGHAAGDALISLYFIRFRREIKRETAGEAALAEKDLPDTQLFLPCNRKTTSLTKAGFSFKVWGKRPYQRLEEGAGL